MNFARSENKAYFAKVIKHSNVENGLKWKQAAEAAWSSLLFLLQIVYIYGLCVPLCFSMLRSGSCAEQSGRKDGMLFWIIAL